MNKKSKTYQKIKPLASIILEGKILCIDPSTGSESSMPGYACYDKGELTEYGIIEVDSRLNKSLRLYEISRTVREDFDKADILIVEYIPPMTYKGPGKKGMSNIALAGLQKGIGAIMAAQPYANMIEIPESAWRHHKPDEYVKRDDWDARVIGLCAINIARHIIKELK